MKTKNLSTKELARRIRKLKGWNVKAATDSTAEYQVELAKRQSLLRGTYIEMEHTQDLDLEPWQKTQVATKIAKTHLEENPHYYDYSKGSGKEYLIKLTPSELHKLQHLKAKSRSKASSRQGKRGKRRPHLGKLY